MGSFSLLTHSKWQFRVAAAASTLQLRVSSWLEWRSPESQRLLRVFLLFVLFHPTNTPQQPSAQHTHTQTETATTSRSQRLSPQTHPRPKLAGAQQGMRNGMTPTNHPTGGGFFKGTPGFIPFLTPFQSRSPSSALLPFFFSGEGSSTKIDCRKNRVPKNYILSKRTYLSHQQGHPKQAPRPSCRAEAAPAWACGSGRRRCVETGSCSRRAEGAGGGAGEVWWGGGGGGVVRGRRSNKRLGWLKIGGCLWDRSNLDGCSLYQH